jgi:hypothetical protein
VRPVKAWVSAALSVLLLAVATTPAGAEQAPATNLWGDPVAPTAGTGVTHVWVHDVCSTADGITWDKTLSERLGCLARAAAERVWPVALFSVLAALAIIMAFRSRRVRAGIRALKSRATGILRLFYWPALGAGLFYSMVTTWIEWKYARGYDYNDHLIWAALFAGIFTGLLAVAVKRLLRAVRAEKAL